MQSFRYRRYVPSGCSGAATTRHALLRGAPTRTPFAGSEKSTGRLSIRSVDGSVRGVYTGAAAVKLGGGNVKRHNLKRPTRIDGTRRARYDFHAAQGTRYQTTRD